MTLDKYQDITVPAGHVSPFEQKANLYGRWDGLMLDVIMYENGTRTTSFWDPSTALSILQQNGNVRKPRPGDIVFLSENSYVGLALHCPNRYTVRTLLGWWPDGPNRKTAIMDLNVRTQVLAAANPVLKFKTRGPDDTFSRLRRHPATRGLEPVALKHGIARFQRYCGHPATGVMDEQTLARLTVETSPATLEV